MERYKKYLSIIIAQLNFLLFMQIIASMNKRTSNAYVLENKS